MGSKAIMRVDSAARPLVRRVLHRPAILASVRCGAAVATFHAAMNQPERDLSCSTVLPLRVLMILRDGA